MSDADLKRRVEAVLFGADAPVDMAKLSDVLSESSRAGISDAIRQLNEDYEREGRSFGIEEVAGGWQFYCKPEYSKWIRELHKGRVSARLSQAALETLAIVAYKQPIVRAEIEIIRGVDASGVLSTLLKRNLVTIVGRAPGMGRALMYGTTKEFLRYFGLNSVTDLPRLEEFAEVLGLNPEELEMTIQGAESLSAMSEEAASNEDTDSANAEAVDGSATDDAEDDSGSASGESDETTGEVATESVAGERAPAETVEALAKQEPAVATAGESAAEAPPRTGDDTIQRVPVSQSSPGDDSHNLRDSDLARALDED